mgnify:CR=1 FL=1
MDLSLFSHFAALHAMESISIIALGIALNIAYIILIIFVIRWLVVHARRTRQIDERLAHIDETISQLVDDSTRQ